MDLLLSRREQQRARHRDTHKITTIMKNFAQEFPLLNAINIGGEALTVKWMSHMEADEIPPNLTADAVCNELNKLCRLVDDLQADKERLQLDNATLTRGSTKALARYEWLVRQLGEKVAEMTAIRSTPFGAIDRFIAAEQNGATTDQ